MIVVDDSMVLIHLAKITLLEKSCDYFGEVIIPQMVFDEVVKAGRDKGYPDALLVEGVVKKGKVKVRKVRKKALIEKANDFSIYRGEAEAVALYWQEKADCVASDDDNVRSKKDLLGLQLIGTPSIILGLYKNKKIGAEKARQSISKLRRIGWFSSQVMDQILMEVGKNE